MQRLQSTRITLDFSSLLFALLVIISYVGILISVIMSKNRADDSLQSLVRSYKTDLRNKERQYDELKTTMETMSAHVHIAAPTLPAILSSSSTHKHASIHHGVIILGMHRSGTSIIGGLINKMGLNTGGPLIAPAEDNEKGFFERLDVVLQNDAFMSQQGVWYASKTEKYDHLLAIPMVYSNNGNDFKEGKRALAFLNNPSNFPYMLKDPRLCITLRTWLPLLSHLPVILFTYRHPLDVALSLHNREQEKYRIVRGLMLWYVYNRRAIESSNDLCRVVASHKMVMTNPKSELDRIVGELRECGLAVPSLVSEADVRDFIDVRLQHGRSGAVDDSCTKDVNTLVPPTATWPSPNDKELAMYRIAMHAFCAMQSGDAFTGTYKWDLSVNDVPSF